MAFNKTILFTVLISICAFAGVASLRADEGAEVIQPHQLAVYPNAEPQSQDRDRLLTKDPIVAVKKFYESNLQAGDTLEPFQGENEQGFRLTYHKMIEGKEQSIGLLEVAARSEAQVLHDVLGHLKVLVNEGKHTEEDLQAMVKEYQVLTAAYYRQVQDEEGRSVSEDKKIYRAAERQDRGKNIPEMSRTEKSEGKAKTKELQKQMKALKAKGDIAGMMALAQQNRMSPHQTKTGAAALDELQKDTWDLWVGCLRDLKAAAYWTRLQYAEGALPPLE